MKGEESQEPREGADEIVDRYLNAMTDQSAPASLIPRVQSILAARAARPWWQQSYDRWNRSAQGLFVVSAFFCLALLTWAVSVYSPAALGAWEGGVVSRLISIGAPLWLAGIALYSVLQMMVNQVPIQVYYLVGALIWLGYLFAVGTGAFLCRLVQLQNVRRV